MEEPLIKFNRKSDFEENLFLKRQVKELKEALSKLGIDKLKSKYEIEIGKLKSEVSEWQDKYHEINREVNSKYTGKLNKRQRKNMKTAIKDELVVNQRRQLELQDNRIIELKTEIENLKSNQ